MQCSAVRVIKKGVVFHDATGGTLCLIVERFPFAFGEVDGFKSRLCALLFFQSLSRLRFICHTTGSTVAEIAVFRLVSSVVLVGT